MADEGGIGQDEFSQLDLDGAQGKSSEHFVGHLLRERLDEMARTREAERLHELAYGKIIDGVFQPILERAKVADRLQLARLAVRPLGGGDRSSSGT